MHLATLKIMSLVFEFSVYWEENYRLEDYMYKGEYQDFIPIPPRVIDPANPANNLWKRDSSVLVGKIQTINLSQLIL